MINNSSPIKEEAKNAIRTRRFLTVEVENRPDSVKMEMKGDLPIGVLFPILIKSLGWRMISDEMDPRFRLIAIKENKEIELKSSDTLISADIPSESDLRIIVIDKKSVNKGFAQETILGLESMIGLENGFSVGNPHDGRGNIAPPHWEELVKEPCFIAASGNIFPIRNVQNWVGRPDKGFRPEINLIGEEDKENPTVSRRHAQILSEDGKYFLRPKPSVWGTFARGQELRHSQVYELRDGDQVKFGDVVMIFRLP